MKELWAVKIGPLFQWKGNAWNKGPNASPTVGGGVVYALGGFGELICVTADAGKEQCAQNLPRDFAGEVNPIGGGLEEPTPLGWVTRVLRSSTAISSFAYPAANAVCWLPWTASRGALIWQSKEVPEQACYSSPLGGRSWRRGRNMLQVTNAGIVGVAARDGKLLWSYRRNPAYEDAVIGNARRARQLSLLNRRLWPGM